MKNLRIVYAFVLITVCLVTVPYQSKRAALACNPGPPCVGMPTACLKSIVLAKAITGVVVVPPAVAVTFGVPVTLFIACPTNDNCGAPCPGGMAIPMSATIMITLSMPPAAPVAAGTITLTPPALTCSATGAFNAATVPVTIPAGTAPGLYTVAGTATVTFGGGPPPVSGTISTTGDTVVCLVRESPDLPGKPRLDVQLATDPFLYSAPGDQAVAYYVVTNNDLNNSVRLTAFATGKQGAVHIQGQNQTQGVYPPANPHGDDHPIAFLSDPEVCIPLPPHPYSQAQISTALPTIPPGESILVRVGIRSYGQCRSGSCSESTVRVQGTFADGTPALGCAGLTSFVDTDQPTKNWGAEVNDCDGSGIYDANKLTDPKYRDIYHDSNFDGIPDECQDKPLLRIQQVQLQCAPTGDCSRARPGQPITVRLLTNMPAARVFANGVALSPLKGGQFWQGTIRAESRPGPQTVYTLATGAQGRLGGQIGVYTVVP